MPADSKDKLESALGSSVIGILGTSPIGCLLGVSLACVGVDVTIVDWPSASTALLEQIQELGVRVVASAARNARDAERVVGPRDASRRFSNDVRVLARCNIIFIAVPRACLQEVMVLLQEHAAAGADVVLLQPGSGAAQELVACGLGKGKWRGRHLIDANVQLRAQVSAGAGSPVTVFWHTPLQCSRISLDGRQFCLDSSKRVMQVLKSAGLPVVVEDRLAEVQLHDSTFHRLADSLALASKQVSFSAAFSLDLWRRSLALLIDEALQVLRGAGVPSRRVAGLSAAAQRHYPRVLVAPACIFKLLRGSLPGEILDCPCNSDVLGSLAEASHSTEEIAQLGRRHGISTPRLCFLLDYMKRSSQTEVPGDDLLQQLTSTSPPHEDLRVQPGPETISKVSAEVVGSAAQEASSTAPLSLADTLLVKKQTRPNGDAPRADPAIASPPSAMAFFGADPADATGLRLGASAHEEPESGATDLEMAFSDYKQKKSKAKGSTSGARNSKGDVEAALHRFEQSKDRTRAAK